MLKSWEKPVDLKKKIAGQILSQYKECVETHHAIAVDFHGITTRFFLENDRLESIFRAAIPKAWHREGPDKNPQLELHWLDASQF